MRLGEAGTLAALALFKDRSGDAGRRRSGRGNVKLAYGEDMVWLLRGVISSSASSDMLLISGDNVEPPTLRYPSSTEACRKGLRTRFGERSGLVDRGAGGGSVGDQKVGDECARIMSGALRGLPALECGRGGDLVMIGGSPVGEEYCLGELWIEDCNIESPELRGVKGRGCGIRS